DMAEIARRIWTVLADEAHLLRAAHLRARLEDGAADADKPFEALCDGARIAIDTALMRRRPELKEKARRNAAAAAAHTIVAGLLEKALYPERAPARATEIDGPSLAAMLGDMAGRSLRKLYRARAWIPHAGGAHSRAMITGPRTRAGWGGQNDRIPESLALRGARRGGRDGPGVRAKL